MLDRGLWSWRLRGVKKIYKELREVRKLHGIESELIEKYKKLFVLLTPLQAAVMTKCYVEGLSYADCGGKMYYCERQVKRIIKQSIEQLVALEGEL